MIYMLYEREAGLEMDKAKFNTKTMLNISKMMRPKQGKTLSKRNLNFPEIEKYNCSHSAPTSTTKWFCRRSMVFLTVSPSLTWGATSGTTRSAKSG